MKILWKSLNNSIQKDIKDEIVDVTITLGKEGERERETREIKDYFVGKKLEKG